MVRVVETGSFPAVAREHKVCQAAVARQIAQPEEGSASREISTTDQFANPTALTGPATVAHGNFSDDFDRRNTFN
jgi:hypothetical protein